MSKTVKVLSDGTVAKANMIVYHLGDARPCKILNIKGKDTFESDVVTDLHPGGSINGWWLTSLENLRKATAKERKQYYQSLPGYVQPIVFKPEFEEKLKKLGIKTKFVSNIKEEWFPTESFIKALNDSSSWKSFISSAFGWGNTPEGHDFWIEISRK